MQDALGFDSRDRSPFCLSEAFYGILSVWYRIFDTDCLISCRPCCCIHGDSRNFYCYTTLKYIITKDDAIASCEWAPRDCCNKCSAQPVASWRRLILYFCALTLRTRTMQYITEGIRWKSVLGILVVHFFICSIKLLHIRIPIFQPLHLAILHSVLAFRQTSLRSFPAPMTHTKLQL